MCRGVQGVVSRQRAVVVADRTAGRKVQTPILIWGQES